MLPVPMVALIKGNVHILFPNLSIFLLTLSISVNEKKSRLILTNSKMVINFVKVVGK